MGRSPSPVRIQETLFDDDLISAESAALHRRLRRAKSNRKRIAFGWYGGKYSHLDWLLPLLPACHHYCEPFGGSAAVLLNRSPAAVETYNDLDGEVVNFFRVLRTRKRELIEAIGLTPFSREEFHIACAPPEGAHLELGTGPPLFRAGAAGPHGAGPDGKPRTLGQLQVYVAGGDERGSFALAGERGVIARYRRASLAGTDRESARRRSHPPL
jgi:hypothetical protein